MATKCPRVSRQPRFGEAPPKQYRPLYEVDMKLQYQMKGTYLIPKEIEEPTLHLPDHVWDSFTKAGAMIRVDRTALVQGTTKVYLDGVRKNPPNIGLPMLFVTLTGHEKRDPNLLIWWLVFPVDEGLHKEEDLLKLLGGSKEWKQVLKNHPEMDYLPDGSPRYPLRRFWDGILSPKAMARSMNSAYERDPSGSCYNLVKPELTGGFTSWEHQKTVKEHTNKNTDWPKRLIVALATWWLLIEALYPLVDAVGSFFHLEGWITALLQLSPYVLLFVATYRRLRQ